MLHRVAQGGLELEAALSECWAIGRGYNACLLLSPYKTFSWEHPNTDGPTAKVVSSGEWSTHRHYHFWSNSLERIYSLWNWSKKFQMKLGFWLARFLGLEELHNFSCFSFPAHEGRNLESRAIERPCHIKTICCTNLKGCGNQGADKGEGGLCTQWVAISVPRALSSPGELQHTFARSRL